MRRYPVRSYYRCSSQQGQDRGTPLSPDRTGVLPTSPRQNQDRRTPTPQIGPGQRYPISLSPDSQHRRQDIVWVVHLLWSCRGTVLLLPAHEVLQKVMYQFVHYQGVTQSLVTGPFPAFGIMSFLAGYP